MTLASTGNFSPTTPAAPSGKQNIIGQNDLGSPTANQSFYDQTMVGDTGSGGLEGNVPKPGSGDAAAGKFLKADGTWAVPAGSGGGAPTPVALAPSSPGAFTVAHGLGITPSAVAVSMTSGGAIWQAAAPDATNLYLEASAGGITGNALCWT